MCDSVFEMHSRSYYITLSRLFNQPGPVLHITESRLLYHILHTSSCSLSNIFSKFLRIKLQAHASPSHPSPCSMTLKMHSGHHATLCNPSQPNSFFVAHNSGSWQLACAPPPRVTLSIRFLHMLFRHVTQHQRGRPHSELLCCSMVY